MAEADLKLKEAIGFFEQMLQSMPGDRTSLEFLSVAYEQTGQTEKRRDCLVRLVDCLLQEKDYDKAQVIAGYLSAYTDDLRARAAVERVVEQIQGGVVQREIHRVAQGLDNVAKSGVVPAEGVFHDMADEVHALSHSAAATEMDLVWLWKEKELMPKETCMDVLHILTELPAADHPELVSALALLDEKHPEWTDRLMEEMQRMSDMPLIPLELFDVQPAAAQLLSSTFILVKGAMPFATIDTDVLVAVLNPFSKELQSEVAARIGRTCHFFFVHPKAWIARSAKII